MKIVNNIAVTAKMIGDMQPGDVFLYANTFYLSITSAGGGVVVKQLNGDRVSMPAVRLTDGLLTHFSEDGSNFTKVDLMDATLTVK